jgi:hypothetical protein
LLYLLLMYILLHYNCIKEHCANIKYKITLYRVRFLKQHLVYTEPVQKCLWQETLQVYKLLRSCDILF